MLSHYYSPVNLKSRDPDCSFTYSTKWITVAIVSFQGWNLLEFI